MHMEPIVTFVFLKSVIFFPIVAVFSFQQNQVNVSGGGSRNRSRRHQYNQIVKDCMSADDFSICDPTQGGVCRNQTCVSVCSVRQFRQCSCSLEEDKFCFLCCGSPNHSCRPAHEYHIFKPNGEIWERDSCARCRSWPNGLSCDDRDPKRVCSHGKCVANICHGRPEGSYCDLQKFKICTDGECRDPCREFASHLLTCECDEHSEDRCQLCCFDPSTRRCENAYVKYAVQNRDKRPIFRDGLRCRRGSTCNKYGLCSSSSSDFFRRARTFIPVSLIVWLRILIFENFPPSVNIVRTLVRE